MKKKIDALLKELEIANASEALRGRSQRSRKIRMKLRKLGHQGGLRCAG
jgi:hypothetical protein